MRRSIKAMNRILDLLKVEMQPDKTRINSISRGFQFLGYEFNEGLRPYDDLHI